MVVECARIGAWHRPRYGAGEYDDMSQSALDAAVATRAAFSASEGRLCKRRNCRRCCGVRYQQFSDEFDQTDDPHPSKESPQMKRLLDTLIAYWKMVVSMGDYALSLDLKKEAPRPRLPQAHRYHA
jgi:hypothetical protein